MSPHLGGNFSEVWVYLAASPLLGLTLTLLAYQGAALVSKRCNGHPLANPVLLAVTALVTILWATGTPYRTYFDGAQFVHFLLGPATVALAIPLYAQLGRLRRMAMPLLAALLTARSPQPSRRCSSATFLAPATQRCYRWHRSRSPRRSRWASPNASAACPR